MNSIIVGYLDYLTELNFKLMFELFKREIGIKIKYTEESVDNFLDLEQAINHFKFCYKYECMRVHWSS